MRRALIATLLGATGCGLSGVEGPTAHGPSGREQIVVQGILNAQASEQVLWIERTTAAGEPLQFGLRPLATPPSRVEVRDACGAIFMYQSDAGNPARFVAAFTPAPGRYDLLVEAETATLRATTEVPGPLTLLEPAGDTIRIARDSGLIVRWTTSAPWVAIYLSERSDFSSLPVFLGQDSAFVLLRHAFAPPTSTMAVFGIDSITARVLHPSELGDFSNALAGNVSGGAGFFGALSGDRVVVQRQ